MGQFAAAAGKHLLARAFGGLTRSTLATSSRRLDEVDEWPLRRGSPCAAMSVPPPYTADQFITALTGSPPSNRVAVTVGPNRTLSMDTAYGEHMTALEAGDYTFAVRDASRTEDVHITGPRINVATGLGFRGNKTWKLRLRPGVYRYRSDRPNSHLKGTFVVLAAG